MNKTTPMLEQYLEIKARHQDYILFYHLGDFYEMFFEDALIASRVLEITLTSRNKGAADPVPMCGIPVQAVSGYIARLIDRGIRSPSASRWRIRRRRKGSSGGR